MTLHLDVSHIQQVRDQLFIAPAPSIIRLSFDPVAAGITRSDMLVYIVKALVLFVKQKSTAERCEEMLKIWEECEEERRRVFGIADG